MKELHDRRFLRNRKIDSGRAALGQADARCLARGQRDHGRPVIPHRPQGGEIGPAQPLSEDAIYTLVRKCGAAIGHPDLAPHDLRRTCAKLCRKAGGELEQIQFLLGHASIQTTERYLGSQQDLVQAVNDRVKIRVMVSD
jgi:integrase